MGSLYRRRKYWWIQYYIHGHCIRESSKSDKRKDAARLLAIREGDKARGRNLPSSGKQKFSVLLNDLMIDYQVNERKSIKNVYYQLTAHVLPFFGNMAVSEINGQTVSRYVLKRKQEKVTNDTINGELAIIRRALRLAVANGKLEMAPPIQMLKRNPPKTDDYTNEELAELLKHMPDYLVAVSLFATWTGWRRGEILRLKWSEVNYEHNEIRIQPGHSKSGQVRVLVMTPELRQLLLQRSIATKESAHPLCPYVFNRDGKQIRSIRTAWERARKKANLKDHTFHGFRRTLRRRLDERGISERVGMAIMGHKTRHIYDNYRVVSRRDLEDAAARLSDTSSTIQDTTAQDETTPKR